MKIKTAHNIVKINKNTIHEESDTRVSFGAKGLTIIDNSEMFSGTKYEIKSLKTDEWNKKVTTDHKRSVENIVGNAFGLKKGRNKITVAGIEFANKISALAQFTKDMLLSGFITDVSIETMGAWPDDDDTYKDSSLVGLSFVVMGNNKSAKINKLALNSIEKSKKRGLDTEEVEKLYLKTSKSQLKNKSMKKKKTTIKNKIKKVVKTSILSEKKMEKMLSKVMAPINAKMEEMEQQIFDNGGKAPVFSKTKKVIAGFEGMSYQQIAGEQIANAWKFLKNKNAEAGKKLEDLNKYNYEKLLEANIITNQMTLGDFGNFVISPELLSVIEGFRSDFSALVSKVNFQETLSLQMSWLNRSGDIDMEEVENCDDGDDGNLKPVSEYTASIRTSDLQELAAVTPVCNNATRFLAADMMGDIAQGYRTDYDRKRAQLIIARLQQAVNNTGNKIPYDGTTDVSTLQSWIDLSTEASEEIVNGIFIFNNRSFGALKKRIVGGGIGGPLANIFITGKVPTIDGQPFIIVPNELMPTLDTAETKSFTVEGASVTIDQAVFFVDLSTISARTSGGLIYDLSTEASYEINSTVYSAFQRNEMVVRGAFFRGAEVRDRSKVASMYAAGVS